MKIARFVDTISDRCRLCYTCVRECPAKAIRIVEGQAEVLGERCIACGNCVRVCSQKAKQSIDMVGRMRALLSDGAPVAALVAPSFPAEFTECDYRRMIGMLRKLGFDHVHEVAFGADLVARRIRGLIEAENEKRYVSTACPAIVGFVERYHPELVPSLVPVVSPMVATARVVRKIHGEHVKCAFIGPCIAKKAEADSDLLKGEVNVAITFPELRRMFDEAGIRPEDAEPADFDAPHSGLGALFPISRGMLQTAGISEDLMSGEVVAADGRNDFVEAIREFETGALGARLLEVLCCNGCIMGAGMTSTAPLFGRRSLIGRYVRERMSEIDPRQAQADMDSCADVDLSRVYATSDQRIRTPDDAELAEIMKRLGKETPEDELNCGACGYDSCREHALAIHKGLAEVEMCLPHTIEELKSTIQDLGISNERLADAQAALIHAEKLASMGQLAAGIAHEVNNPLGVVLMYAHLLKDEAAKDSQLAGDLDMIVEQADRCKKIVAGLLHFARQNRAVLQPENIDDLVDRTVRAMRVPAGIETVIKHEERDPVAEIDRDQIVQVITNIVGNAVAAMGETGTLTVTTLGDDGTVTIRVADTGIGIARENLSKIFEPFYTTKQIGKGTGLGLAMTYGIVKMHRGEIDVQSNADPDAGPTGATFTVTLPRRGRQD